MGSSTIQQEKACVKNNLTFPVPQTIGSIPFFPLAGKWPIIKWLTRLLIHKKKSADIQDFFLPITDYFLMIYSLSITFIHLAYSNMLLSVWAKFIGPAQLCVIIIRYFAPHFCNDYLNKLVKKCFRFAELFIIFDMSFKFHKKSLFLLLWYEIQQFSVFSHIFLQQQVSFSLRFIC